jgi:hypothetical protein
VTYRNISSRNMSRRCRPPEHFLPEYVTSMRFV